MVYDELKFDYVFLKCNTVTDVFNYLLFAWVYISCLLEVECTIWVMIPQSTIL